MKRNSNNNQPIIRLRKPQLNQSENKSWNSLNKLIAITVTSQAQRQKHFPYNFETSLSTFFDEYFVVFRYQFIQSVFMHSIFTFREFLDEWEEDVAVV